MRHKPARAIALAVSAVVLLSGCSLTEARGSATAKTGPLDMSNSLRPGLVAMPDYPSSGWEPGELASPSATPAPTPDAKNPLSAIGLQASDLATDRQVSVLPDGTSLGVPTLDFCDAKYPSESLRVKRLQVGAFQSDGTYAGLSTEVVTYESPEAAQQALAEVIKARLNCPVGKQITTFDKHTLKFEFHPAPGPSNTPLVGADSRVIIHTTMVIDGQPQTAFLVYQIAGSVLAAMYASDGTGEPIPQKSLDILYALAGRIAQRLQVYAGELDLADIPGHTKTA